MQIVENRAQNHGHAGGVRIAGGGTPYGFEAAAEPSSVSAQSAVLYEPSSGRVLFQKDAHTPRPMASTTS